MAIRSQLQRIKLKPDAFEALAERVRVEDWQVGNSQTAVGPKAQLYSKQRLTKLLLQRQFFLDQRFPKCNASRNDVVVEVVSGCMHKLVCLAQAIAQEGIAPRYFFQEIGKVLAAG